MSFTGIKSSKMRHLISDDLTDVRKILSLENMISKSVIGCKTMTKERAHFFTQAEQDLLLEGYEEFHELIRTRGNTAKAAQTRKVGWQKVANKLNASNVNTRRTWEQVKVKYKNILQTANKKKADKQKTGGGPDLTPAEELALQQNAHRPVSEGISGGRSSSQPVAGCSGHFISGKGWSLPIFVLSVCHRYVPYSPLFFVGSVAGNALSLEPASDHQDTDEGQIFDEDTVSDYSSGGEEPVASTHDPFGTKSTSKKGDGEKNVRSLYKRYLKQKITYRKLKMRKIQQDMEFHELRTTKMKLQIQILEKQLAEGP
ncbi:uncharacterized protein LOC127529713 [Erpetoichthys calabaricus]|uniref:uncharacterized protein LOC127529713 n=1 Tax=Erpetoichthys calabaricus TaxID=27687 RepID=UPI002233ED34|nr:uncharacterized protein LOC127529713 [Erpetoichthys calabaricus]